MAENADENSAAPDPSPFRASGFRPRTVEGDLGMLEALRDYYVNDPHIAGSGDLLLITGGKPAERAGLIASVLAGFGLDDGERLIRRYLIIGPPNVDLGTARASAWDRFERGVKKMAGAALDDDQRSWFESRFEMVLAPDLNTRSIVALIEAQPERTAIIVIKAAEYRDTSISPFVPAGASGPLAPEDIWAPHLLALGKAIEPIAEEKILYVALDANELTPLRPELVDLLQSIHRFGVMNAGSEASADTILTRRIGQWDAWIRTGHVGLALKDIDDLPPKLDDQKAFLRVQLLLKAGLTPQALAEVREHFLAGNPSSATRVRLALIAEQASASNLARDL
jgi:hypothetical protein